MGSERRSGSVEPITREDCVRYLEAAVKRPGERLVGLEVERLAVRPDGSALPHFGPGGVFDLLERIAVRTGGEVRREEGAPFGVSTRLGTWSLEPGGQIEYSSEPRRTLSRLDADLRENLSILAEEAAAAGSGARMLGIGAHPWATLDSVGWIPRERYRIMSRRLGERGDLAHGMMKMTASVQVNLDWRSGEEAARMMTASMRAGAVAIAMFARSPLWEGKPAGDASMRERIWTRTDPDRSGFIRRGLEAPMGFEEWVDWAFGVPLLFIVRDGAYREVRGLTFGEFVEKGYSGQRAILADWEVHLTTLFPESRFKTYLEVRGADGAERRTAVAIAAFWVGLLYDAVSLDRTVRLFDGITWEKHRELHEQAISRGLQGAWEGRSLREWAGDLVEIAREGLRARTGSGHPDERPWLEPVEEIVLDRGRSPAEDLLAVFERAKGDPGRVLEALPAD